MSEEKKHKIKHETYHEEGNLIDERTIKQRESYETDEELLERFKGIDPESPDHPLFFLKKSREELNKESDEGQN